MKWKALVWATVGSFAVIGGAPAEELVVPAAEVDRKDAVLRLPLELRGKVWEGVKVTDAAGQELRAQIAPAGLAWNWKTPGVKGGALAEVVVVVPEIKAGEKPVLKAEAADAASGGDQFKWHDEAGKHADLKFGEKGVLRYIYEAIDEQDRERTYKPYHHVFNPSGEGFLTKGHGGQFTHHRGIYYGFSKTGYTGKDGKMETADTWHCKPGAYQGHQEFVAEATGPLMGRHQVKIGWHGKGGELIATEHREIAAIDTQGGLLVDFTSLLTTELEKVKLDGDPQHAGFQFRASQEVSEKTAKQTVYIRKDGVGKPGETVNTGKGNEAQTHDQPWKGMSFVVGGERFTCSYLDHPDNPKPAVSSERDYGRFGSYFVKEVTPSAPLLVRYRLILQKGQGTQEEIAEMAANFVANP